MQCSRSSVRTAVTAHALNRRSLLLGEPPFLRAATIGDVYMDGLVILSILHFSDVHAESRPIEVQRAVALYDFPQSRQTGKGGGTLTGEGSTLTGEFLGERSTGISGTPGFPLERRVSLMLTTIVATVVDR